MTASAAKWKIVHLGEVARLYQPKTISGQEMTRSGYPVYGANGQVGYYSAFNHELSQVAVTCRGNTCGRVNFVPARSWITGNAMVVNIDSNPAVDKRFLYHYLQSSDLSQLVTGSGQPQIVRGPLAAFQLVLPPLVEQKRIASAIDDADELVTTLKGLVAKKQAIKQGMMQQLLTGRTRLPGFEGEWCAIRLRDAGRTFGGLIGKVKDDFGAGSAKFVTFTEVMEGARLFGRRLERVRVRGGERQNQVQRGDILFNGSSETPEEVALAAAVDFEPSPSTYLNSFCFGYRLKKDNVIDPVYLSYYFRSNEGRSLVSALAQGATRYNIAKTKLLELSPELPPIDEQREIVTVLRAAEDEIEVLNGRLTKARAIKQGMMQQLLTGRTRLPAGSDG